MEEIRLQPQTGKNKTRKRRVQFTGGFFLLLGVPGLVLPFLQGILFIVIGLCILSLEWRWLSEKLDVLAVKYPWLGEPLLKGRGVARRLFSA